MTLLVTSITGPAAPAAAAAGGRSTLMVFFM